MAEAMASGAVTVLDRSFESLFEDGAVYCRPEETTELVNRFIASPEDFVRQSRAGRDLVERKFSLAAYPQRMRELYESLELPNARSDDGQSSPEWCGRADRRPRAGDANRSRARQNWHKAQKGAVSRNERDRPGHITRLMAIAERMSPNVEPVFLTMSVGSSIIHARGHPADYIPSAPKIGVTEESWNRAYAQELLTAIEVFDVGAVVFDINYPYPGLIRVLSARPDIAWVWVRRGMWAPHHVAYPVMKAAVDMVIEPGEFAYDEDLGITAALRNGVVLVPPIFLSTKAPGYQGEWRQQCWASTRTGRRLWSSSGRSAILISRNSRAGL